MKPGFVVPFKKACLMGSKGLVLPALKRMIEIEALSRSAEALLPPPECGGSHHESRSFPVLAQPVKAPPLGLEGVRVIALTPSAQTYDSSQEIGRARCHVENSILSPGLVCVSRIVPDASSSTECAVKQADSRHGRMPLLTFFTRSLRSR